MIDTIVFRIRNLLKHEQLVKKLHQVQVHGVSEYTKDIPIEDVTKKIYNSGYWRDWSTGREFEKSYRSHLPSWHYDIAYSVNFSQNFIEFNFSIPKLLYRTNVFQFVPHYFDSDYSLVYGNSIEERGKSAFKRLRRFMTWFCEYHLGGQVDWYDIQVVRIDLSFNKLFRYAQESKDYIMDLKRIKKKHARESKIFTDGEFLGLYYVHEDYTFKVYHKGLEFAAPGHDATELKRQGVSSDKIEVIQNFADRMVRYEVEFRTGMIDRIWKRKVFRGSSVRWKKARRYSNQYRQGACIIKRIDGKRVKLYRNPPVKDQDGNEYTKKERDAMRMTKEQWALVKYGDFYNNKTFQFFLQAESHIAKDSPLWDAEIPSGNFTMEYEQKFSKALWDGMVDQFRVFYREFSIEYQEDIRHVVRRIKDKEYKEIKGEAIDFYTELEKRTGLKPDTLKKISLKKFQFFLSMLKEHSFSEIKAMGKEIIPERTFYRYKKVFVALGFSDFAPSKMVPRGDDTFTDYLFWTEEVNAKLNFANLFKSKF